MRKHVFLTILMVFTLFLVSCKDDQMTFPTIIPTDPTVVPTDPTFIPSEPIDLTIQVLEEKIINNQIHVSFVIADLSLNQAGINQLMHEIANQMYASYFNQIDGRLFFLNLYGYASADEFSSQQDPSFGWFVYGIHLSVDQPGLTFVRSE